MIRNHFYSEIPHRAISAHLFTAWLGKRLSPISPLLSLSPYSLQNCIDRQPTITFCRELIEAADENSSSSPPVAFSSGRTRFQPFSSVSLLQTHPILPFWLNMGAFSPFWPLLTFFGFYAMFIAQIAGKFIRLFKIRNYLRKIRMLLLRRKLCFGSFRVMAKKIFRQQRCSISTDSLAPA